MGFKCVGASDCSSLTRISEGRTNHQKALAALRAIRVTTHITNRTARRTCRTQLSKEERAGVAGFGVSGAKLKHQVLELFEAFSTVASD